MAATSVTAHADTLAVVAWDDGGDAMSGWWSDDEAALTPTPLDLALLARSPAGGWIDVREVVPNDSVSRVLRVVPLTPRNAVALGALYDADTVVVGEAWVASIDAVPWLGLERVGVGVDVEVIDVASGARRGRVETVGLGVASTHDEALVDACAMAVSRIETVVGAVSSGGISEVGSAGVTVVVRSTPTALPYVAFRGALREVHPGVLDIREVFATEGSVAVAVDLDEGVDASQVADAVEAMGGGTFGDARVVTVQREGDRLDVTLGPAITGDE